MEDLEGNDVQFQRRRACSSSEMNTNPSPVSEKISETSIGAVSLYKSSIASSGEPFFSSGWDSLGSFVSHDDPAYLEMVPKFPSFSGGNFSEMGGSFVLPQYLQIVNDDSLSNIQENRGTGPSPRFKSRKRGSDTASFEPYEKVEKDLGKNSKGESSDGIREQDQKKPKIDDNNARNPTRKPANVNSSMAETSKENYIHVRARRGEATNSHSLAERIRREKISDRMKQLQELVPGCNKITGKAMMLDEIINYVQSLQQQVEFLSMKLATVNPEIYAEIGGESHGVSSSQRVFARRMLSSQTGFPQFLENELQVHFQMGLDSG